MFNTKLEVDKHVESCLKNINNEAERNLRCFAFARLYFKVGEYEQARRYVTNYLNAKPTSAEAWSFLGKALEKQGKIEAAIDALRKSLDVDSKQNSVLLKVCELLASDNMSVDLPSLQYYCERAQRIDPQNPVVYNLKERLVVAESQDPNDVTRLLLTELETRSTDVQLRVRLLRHLLQNNQIKEAYKHASDIEWKSMPIFLNSLSWYEVLSDVLTKYQRDNSVGAYLTWEFWMLFVTVLDKLAALTVNDHFNNIKSSSECTLAVFNLDQALSEAAKGVSTCPERPLVQEFLSHYRAQLCFHLSTLLFKQSKNDFSNHNNALNTSLPLLFTSFHTQPPEIQGLWLDHSPEIYRLQVQKWYREAAFRCSQVGHMLLAAAKDRKVVLIEKLKQNSSGLWREQLFKKLFITRDEQSKMKSSYFVNCQNLIDIPSQLPDLSDLAKYDDFAQSMFPDSLHNLVWICMNKKLHTFKCTIFEGLQYSVKNLNNCSAESLNVLDIESFVYLTTLTMQGREDKRIYYYAEKLPLMPASITDPLGTLNQVKWFKAAYQMYKNEYGVNLSEVRLNLIKGIEVVRCVGNHGIEVQHLVSMANAFMERAKKLTKQSEIEFNEARADLYWKAALPILEKLQRNQAVTYGVNRLFESKCKELTQPEIAKYIDDARLFSGVQFMKKKEFENALRIFDGLKSPYATYHQAQIYKTMAEEQVNQNKENVTSEMRSKHVILLSKSRDCFYLTLDRLRDPSVDRKHPLNKQLATDIEKIERLLSRIDSEYTGNDCDGLSEENVSSIGSIGEHGNNFYSSTLYPSESLTPHLDRTSYSNRYRLELSNRREARPSPERLDAQLRKMQASRDATLGHILEQNRMMVDSHRSLMDEFRWLKDAVANINSSVNDVKSSKVSVQEELQSIKHSLTELKTVVEELQSFRDITDLVHEMKKEIAELKKDQAKSKNQLSEEDLYVLDDEYTGDYGINSNASGFNASNLYPNYHGRLPAYPPAAALYPGMYPVYPYANLGLPPAAALPFGQDPQITALGLAQGFAAQAGFGQPNLAQTKPAWDVTHPALAQLNLVPPVVAPQLQTSSSTQQSNIFRDTTATITPVAVTSNIFSSVTSVSTTVAPVNVVITTSDPLPKTTVTTSQVLSVTIPPQHLKGNIPPKTTQAHNYQIPLPTTYSSTPNTTPSIISKPSPAVVTDSMAYFKLPSFDNITSTPDLGLEIEKSLNQSFNKSADSTKGNTSVEDDPCPDFKPIIPLPDEVPVNTGEENEEILFNNRAKLFRFVNNEWKERGIGDLKILEDKDTKKIRILMRRDQVHKICANHFLTKDIKISRMQNNSLAFIWAANDFAEQQSVAETFCVRFKTEEIANDFLAVFEQSQKKLPETSKIEEKTDKEQQIKTTQATSLGGFTFTSKPTFKPKEEVTPSKPEVTTETANNCPFASFTFGSKTSTPTTNLFSTPISSTTVTPTKAPVEEKETEFVPTTEFKPVVPLPDLVETKTGEENAEILFECHAKLLKYDTATKEWKECGEGTMKILKEHTVRLLMRRDLVLKVCCNHQLLKKMSFSKRPNNPRTLSWCAQDFSEGTLKPEMFTIKFKLLENMEAFYNALISAQQLLDDNNVVKFEQKMTEEEPEEKIGKDEKKVKGEPPEASKNIGFGDKFKPKAGTWKCKICFIHNEGKDHYCIACESPKSNTSPKKTSEAVFSFGLTTPVSTTASINKSQFSFGTPSSTSVSASFTFAQKPSWGDAFKVQEGSWECPACFVRNEANAGKCVACQQAKESEKQAEVATSSWGEQFKPKPGSWECKDCLLRNEPDRLYCASCENPKDDSVPKKADKVEAGDTQFKFGLPTFNFVTQPATSFTFGSKPPPATTANDNQFKFATSDEKKDQFVFGSPQQHAFEFTPRSPRRHSSGCQGDEENDSLVEDEGDHIYFKPVVPLPDKIDVKTGEEAEQVLYCHRAKLFRFVDGEWKERGIGDLKILLNTDNNKLRVLMRREQVLKICLNHSLTSSIEYKAKDDKTWLFTAPDYSEGEINHWQFCLRFKTPDMAQDFKKAVDDALKKSSSTEAITEDSSEVEFVSETQVTLDEELEASRLKLPPKFMAYRQLPDCSCETCKKDDVILSELLKKSNSDKPKPVETVEPSTPSATSKSILAKPKLFLSPESKTETDAFKKFSFSLKTEAETTTAPSVTTSTTRSIFPTTTPSKSLFQNISFTSPSTSGGNIFSDAKPKNIFTGNNLFQQPTDNVFNIFSAKAPAEQVESKNDEPILKCDSELSFSDLQNAPNVLALGKKFEEGDKPFAHLGSGAPVFASLAKNTQKKKDSDDECGESDHEGGDSYDPHYEPIVPLPEAIVVSTGEEDEVPIFNERTKLYRYDDNTKEWKERGVGQMKILHHPTNGTYRFILRRELIHKVVLNMLITPNLDLQPMVTSDRAWLWGGYNHSDDGAQLEKLAAKFKSVELANTFRQAVETAMTAVKENRDKSLPSTIQNFGDVSDEHSEARDDYEDDDDDEDTDEDDEDERAVLFMKTCHLQEENAIGQWNDLATGDIVVYYDPDVCGSRIYMCDEACTEISNTIIGTNTEMLIEDNTCAWKAVEWADANQKWRGLRAIFPTSEDAEEFHCRYVESLQFAHENGVIDQLIRDAGE